MRSQCFLLATLFCLTSQARAQSIVVEPDDFADLTDLTNAVPHVTLSATLYDGSPREEGGPWTIIALASELFAI